MTKNNSKEPSMSLLDSVFYQSALRFNRMEDNRLRKHQLRIRQDFEKRYTNYDNHSRNSYDWAIEMRKNSGRSFPVHPSRMKRKLHRPQTVPDERPACCVLYGKIIGERPVLLKNFLGTKAKKKKPETTDAPAEKGKDHDQTTHHFEQEDGVVKATNTHLRLLTSREANHERRTINESPRDPETGEVFKSFMYDNKLVTQVPVGYSRSSSRPRTSFVSHTSEMLRPENTRIPGYYRLRHKYILPPVEMSRFTCY